MCQHPVLRKIFERGIATHMNADESALFSKRAAAPYAFSVRWNDAQKEVRNGKAAVICAHGLRGPLNPFEQILFGNLQLAFFDDYVYSRISDNDSGRHLFRSIGSAEKARAYQEDG